VAAMGGSLSLDGAASSAADTDWDRGGTGLIAPP